MFPRLLVGVPLLLILVVFALSNAAPVRIGMWPSASTIELPLSFAILAMTSVGFIVGGFVIWLNDLGDRRRARRAEQAIRLLEAEVRNLKDQLSRPAAPEPPRLPDPARPPGTPE